MRITDAIKDKALFGAALGDLETWSSWICFLKAITGEKLTREERKLFDKCCGGRKPPKKPVKRAACVCGRRSGKSRVASLVSSWKGLFTDFSEYLSAGENAVIVSVSPDRQQSRLVFEYTRGFLHSNPMFHQMIKNETKERIQLATRCEIQILTASHRTVRGRAIPCATFDESAFLFQHGYATSDTELARAIWPSMIQFPEPLLLLISSPYAKVGLLWELYKDFFGKDDASTLIWQADSLTMNPTLDRDVIEQDLITDSEGSQAEWLGLFRKGLSNHLNPEIVDNAVVPKRHELGFQPNTVYSAFVDSSGGSRDAMAMCVTHKEMRPNGGEMLVVDLLKEVIPDPVFDPHETVSEFCEILKRYHCREIQGDRYSAQWCAAAFSRHGVRYVPCPYSKSELYLSLEPILNTGSAELLDNPKAIAQLKSLERKTRSGGKDVVDAPGQRPEDLANVLAGALVMANESGVGQIKVYDWLKYAI